MLFVSIRAQGLQVYSMEPDGSDPGQVTPDIEDLIGGVDLAHDGTCLVYDAGSAGLASLQLMTLKDSTVTRLTGQADSSSNLGPVWAPDGRHIAYASTRDGDYEIYVMKKDGSNVRQLTHNSTADLLPFWSPEGDRLGFTSFRDGNGEIYVMNADGSGQVNLTNNPADDFASAHAWSPDGSKLLFVSSRDGERWLYAISVSGLGVTRLIDSLAPISGGLWSPDGQRVAFRGEGAFSQDIFVMNLDGSGLANLTDDAYFDEVSAWIE